MAEVRDAKKCSVFHRPLSFWELGTLGFGQTGPTLKKITAFDLPGPAGKRFDYLDD